MKKYAIVKQKHLYNGQRNVMYKGEIEVHNQPSFTSLCYIEYDGSTKVTVEANSSYLMIQRTGDVESTLKFVINQKTRGRIMTEFGLIELDIFTHKYIKKENSIAIEYDIMQNDVVIEGYRIIWNIKEEAA